MLAVGELEWVPALTVTLPVWCSLIIPDHERQAFFFAIQSPVWQSLGVQSVRVVFASVATGIGIDLHRVDTFIQYGAPSSIEDYFQASGRRGQSEIQLTP